MIGAYVGTSTASLGQFESWLGSDVDFLFIHSGRNGWADWQGSIGWAVNLWKDTTDVKKQFSIPLFANEGNLEAAAAGDYDAYYLTAAQTLAAASGDGPIYIRTGWEFNGDWQPWASAGMEAEYIEAYRNFVDAFRSVSDRFVFDWSVNVGGSNDPALSYPGDDYVDIISMDFYYNTAWDKADPNAAWDYMVNRKYGLQWLEDFADAHGKQTAYPEWGVNSDTAGPYIAKALAWFETHDVAYWGYWNSNSAFTGQLDNDQYPNASEAFRVAIASLEAGEGDAVILHGDTANTTFALTGAATSIIDLGGIDTVTSSITRDLSHFPTIENLTLTGTANINGSGNSAANVITGNTGNNALSGLEGNDTLIGGDGNDTLTGGAGNDTINGGNGIDYCVLAINRADCTVAYDSATAKYVLQSAALGTDTVSNVEYFTFLDSTVAASTFGAVAATAAATLNGTSSANTLNGTSGDDTINGLGGNDTLSGQGGNDTLDGGTGGDKMSGGTGNDTYVVDSTGDTVTESSSAGTDTVKSSISYTLGSNIENLVLTGSSAINGTGNTLANSLTGNSAANTLSGGSGDDILSGKLGNDTLTGGSGKDTFVLDTARGSTNIDKIIDFNVADDTIALSASIYTGLALGTLSADAFYKGTAAADASDRFIYNASTGALYYDADGKGGVAQQQIATLAKSLGLTSADFLVAADGAYAAAALTTQQAAAVVEAETSTPTTLNGTSSANTLYGTSADDAINGLGGNDTLNGQGGNDTLDGGTGSDRMSGGTGNDTYVVDNTGDTITEGSNAGTDTVKSSISFTLGSNIENLVLSGSNAINGTGNSLANSLTGNSAANSLSGGGGNDTLYGKLGNDTLTGGYGKDTFVFDTTGGSTNIDKIIDFNVADDTIALSASVYAGLALGTLSADAFYKGSAAADASDRLIYNSSTGALYYDPDGIGGVAQQQIATLSKGLGLTSADFLLLA